MRKSKFFKVLSIILTLVMVLSLSGCGSSDKDKNEGGNSSNTDSSVTSQDKNSSSDNNNSSDASKNTSDKEDNSGDTQGDALVTKQPDLGDLDAEDLKIYPEDKQPSMYFYNAKEITDETFFPDQTDILGDPYVFNGTILEQYDAITDYLELNEFGKELKGLDTTSVSYKIMTQYGPVIVINVLPYGIKYLKDNLDSNVNGIKYYKCWYNDLENYKKMPEIGDTGRFYGIYFGYSNEDECPVFTYGVSNLAHDGYFPTDYLKSRTDEVKKAKHRNLITYKYPVGWSNTLDNGGNIEIYFPESKGALVVRDFEADEMPLDDVVKMFTGEDMFSMMPEDMPEGEAPDEMLNFNIEDYIKVHEKAKVSIGDGTISAYKLNVSTKMNDTSWQDELVYCFQAKRSIMILEFVFFDMDSFNTDTSNIDANIDYTDEGDISDVNNDSGNISEKTDETDINSVIMNEISDIIKSVEICGF